MPYSASGTFPNIEITQSGTETNLAGLAGLPGVTTNGFEYLLSGARLIQTGSLIIDPTENYLRFASNCPYPNLDYRGTLQLGRKTTVSGAVQYTTGTALIFERQSTTYWNTFSEGAIVSSVPGSTFLGYGGSILTKSPICLAGLLNTVPQSATITIEALNIYCIDPAVSAGILIIFATTAGSPVNVSGLVLGGLGAKVLFATDYQSFSARLDRSFVEINTFAPSDLTLQNLILANNQDDYDFVLNGDAGSPERILYNLNGDTGSDISVFATSTGRGIVASQRDFRFNIKNAADSPISGAICLVSVKNNGGRFNPAERGDIDWTGLGNQTATTNGSGLATIRTLTGAIRFGQSFRTSQSNSTADDYVVAFGSYLHSIGSRFAIAKGNGGTEISANILSDTGVVQTNPATVAAYAGYSVNTGTNTVTMSDPLLDGARAYDRWKWWKIQPSNFALEYPSASGLICVKDGTILDFGNRNVIIDGVRFRSHPTVTRIKTTGLVTTPNGGLCDVLIDDANGQRYSPLITINSFPNGSKITIIFGGVPIDVALNQNAPYSYRFRGTTPATVKVQVERDGYEAFTQDVPLALADVPIFALMPALTDADAVNAPEVNFKRLFSGDATVKAILMSAKDNATLQDFVGRAMVFDFGVLAWKNAWNAIVSKSGGTTPTLTDVNRWRQYATDTGFAILFRDTPSNQVGEVI